PAIRDVSSTALSATRRDVLLGTAGSAATAGPKPLCEVPLHRLEALPGQVGGRFASVTASVNGQPVELMVDSGLSEGM
ncbi:unnamed protein product, partial [Effrenium voratum]